MWVTKSFKIGTFMSYKKILILVFLFLMTSGVWANGQLSFGATYNGWNANYAAPAQDNGYEGLVPVAISYRFIPELNVYSQGEFMIASDTYTSGGSNGTYTLSNLSDTVFGAELTFKTFSLKSIFNAAINIPTGDTSWNTKEQSSIPPTQFIDSRYSGRGLGASGFYGVSLPDGRGEYSLGVGYLYSGAFNPSYGNVTTVNSLSLGSAVFLALNRVMPFKNDENEFIRFSVYQSFPSTLNGQNYYQLGTNFNASYNWSNPKALSFELGGQFYLPSAWSNNGGPLVTESLNSNGPKIYADSTYAFDDFSITGQAKYIFQNDYSAGNAYYNGGGFLVGIEPAYNLKMDGDSTLKFSAGLDDVYANNYGVDAKGNLTNVNFLFWTVTTAYEMKL
jgi:hypothetical protein